MKRVHRRLHLIIWIVLAPMTIVVGVLCWTLRPNTPYTDLPRSIQTLTTAAEEE